MSSSSIPSPSEQPQPTLRDFPPAQGLYDPALEKDACGVGLIAHIKGEKSHQYVEDALTMLSRMDHRGACGCEANTGDGAGILTALPDPLLRRVAQEAFGAKLPQPGHYGVGMLFLPRDEAARAQCRQVLEQFIVAEGQKLLGFRVVPTNADRADIGPSARRTEPTVEQVFIAAGDDCFGDDFERRLYLIRQQTAHTLRQRGIAGFYACSFSSKVIVYKGQLTSVQLSAYYDDLHAPDYVTHVAMVHSRFSTNTFPSWDRAQPMRFMSHNGEINTLKGNVNWITAREGMMDSSLFHGEFQKLRPIIDTTTSDSGMFDNVLELLLMAGRPLPEAMMMMVPEAWENHESMSRAKRAFYEYHSNLMEPWDGPASIVFTDGHYVGATLDRNGLRPSRYYVTSDDRVIMASEVGVLPVEPELVVRKGRLQPGRMFLVDFEQGRIIADEELKAEIAAHRPYRDWLSEQRLELKDLAEQATYERYSQDQLLSRLQAFGYTVEHLDLILLPMVRQSQEPLGSMGNDTALAVLSDEPRLLYDYFKQLFAQVTNPPIDPIREEVIMSLQTYIGPEGNLLQTTPGQCHRLLLKTPILSNQQMAQLKLMDQRGWRAKIIDITYSRLSGPAPLTEALDRICREAEEAIAQGYSLVVLSDRAVGPDRVALSSLLAVGAVHHHLVRQARRTRLALLLETGEAREVHHFCTLFGFGVDAVNPYLTYEALWQARDDGLLDRRQTDDEIVEHYQKAVQKGLLKVMSKMGISTLASYKGAQIFEAVGLHQQVVDRCFAGTASRIQGVSFEVLAEEALRRHAIGYPARTERRLRVLPNPGEYHWRSGGEKRMLNPQTIHQLQMAARTNSAEAYAQFAKLCNEDSRSRCTIRGLVKLKTEGAAAIPLDQVEPAAEIVKRFRTGAMSFGSISKEAHETLAIAMNRLGGRSNTGEGGEDSQRFIPLPNGDSKRSSIKQVASGRFGVTSWYLTNADVLQIKIAQGAKPGEGGQLPGHKVNEVIAKVRHSTPGVGLISPPPHHDIYSIEDLAQLIYDLKNTNPGADISVKLVSAVGVGTVAAGVAKAHADHILVSGAEGGTGASPLTSIKHAGLPWELGLAETHQTLVLNDLRSRVRLEVDGQLKTGRDVIIGALLGAEEFGFSTAPLITLGCIMMRKCHLNTCPVGIATQDPRLRAKFKGQPEHVVNYLFMIAQEARELMAQLGIARFDDLIGRVDLLETEPAAAHWKARGVALDSILQPARKPHAQVQVRKLIAQDHGIAEVLDRDLIAASAAALETRKPVQLARPINNLDRTVGAMLSHEVSKRFGEAGLPDDTISVKFTGSAGQSFGAWTTRGITLELEGDANDYVGKGLCGGRVIVYPPRDSAFVPEENIIVGNVALYGATSGQAFFRGVAAERFAVRNSGASAVVEGVGDHGCEYMTGGRVVILGPTGRNFAAGMSGGIAYIHDPSGAFITHCNLDMVELEMVEDHLDRRELKQLVTLHRQFTGSTVAEKLLSDWETSIGQFVKVMPTDYKRVLREMDSNAQVTIESIALHEKL